MTISQTRHDPKTGRPLQGVLVLDFSQFLSGSLATLRLADMGARVIKIERPGTGDLGRTLYLSDTDVHGENTLFHAINRNKESYAADLKNPSDLQKLRQFIARADVMVQNFRPGSNGAIGAWLRQCVTVKQPVGVRNRYLGMGTAEAWRDRPGSGPAGTGAFGDHVAEWQRGRSTYAHGSGHCRYACGAQSV